MKQFFKFFFASCLGFVVGSIVLTFLSIAIFSSIAASGSQPKPIGANSVLHLTFDQAIPEQTNNLEVSPFDLENQKILGLHDILYALEAASKDDKIKAIFLEMESVPVSFASVDLLRKAIQTCKDEGKFVVAYAKYYTQGAYYLASVADRVHVSPIGSVDFRGFSASLTFFKDMLDRVGINMQILYVGKFKGATEPYRRNDLSPENRLQIRDFITQLYDHYVEQVGISRNISPADLKKMADDYIGNDPNKALELGLIDGVGYRDNALSELRDAIGLGEKDKIKLVTLQDYYSNNPPSLNLSIKNKVAVIYAEGAILDGKGSPGSTGDKKYVDIIDKLTKDDNVKAVVLRVNSPGGSAMASENMWRSLSLLKEAGKPLVVSMGDYAASGGYYIACMADSIVAQKNTITGSIGIFSIIPSTQKLFNEKLGIHFDTVKTGRFSLGLNTTFDMTPEERALYQAQTNRLYDVFIKRVSDGRHLPEAQVREIAEGRVWTGASAQKIGLVDKIGDLDDAIALAASMSNLETYRVSTYPKIKEPLLQMIEELTGTGDSEALQDRLIRSELADYYPYYKQLKDLSAAKGAQARLPLVIPFH
ncbi:MAG: signal peptide peptidase SppA [Saprospiraceae bacterium]